MAMGKLLTPAVVVMLLLRTGGGGGGELLTAVVMMFNTAPLVSPCESAISLWGSDEQIQDMSRWDTGTQGFQSGSHVHYYDSDPDPACNVAYNVTKKFKILIFIFFNNKLKTEAIKNN